MKLGIYSYVGPACVYTLTREEEEEQMKHVIDSQLEEIAWNLVGYQRILQNRPSQRGIAEGLKADKIN